MVQNVLITQSYLATALGISQPMVTRLKARGMPVHDVEAARAWRRAHLNVARVVGQSVKPLKPPRSAGGDEGGSFASWRTRREKAAALAAEQDLRERSGELVEVAKVREALQREHSELKQGLMNLAPRLAPVLAAESDTGRCCLLIDAEVRRLLHTLCGTSDDTEGGRDGRG